MQVVQPKKRRRKKPTTPRKPIVWHPLTVITRKKAAWGRELQKLIDQQKRLKDQMANLAEKILKAAETFEAAKAEETKYEPRVPRGEPDGVALVNDDSPEDDSR